MFEIFTNDSQLIWSTASGSRHVLEPTVEMEVNKAGSLSFKMLPGHPYYNTVVKMVSTVELVQDGAVKFRGRVFSDDSDFRNIKNVNAEGVLSFLNDSVVRYVAEMEMDAGAYFRKLIADHNAMVEPKQRLNVGTVTVSGNITVVNEDAPTTWEAINTQLLETVGGYIVPRYEADGTYIDYLAELSDVSTQDVAFSVNLLDLEKSASGESLKTCVIPLGAVNDETGERVDIKGVNGGVDYITAPDAVAFYGSKIYEVVVFDDVTDPVELLRLGRAELEDKINIPESISIKALDLHLTTDKLEAFSVGDLVKVYSEPHGINNTVLLAALTLNLANPAESIIDLNISRKSYIESVRRENTERVENIRKEIVEKVTAERETILSQSQSYTNTAIETSEQHTTELLAEYATTTDLANYSDTFSTQLTQTADGIGVEITRISEKVTTENGDITRTLNEFKKYFKFDADGLEIGLESNPIKLTLDNNSIVFSRNGVPFGWWDGVNFHTGNIYVDVNERAQFGNFSFIPRSDGSLSFVKVT